MLEEADRVRKDAENLEFESQALLKEADDIEGKITDVSRIEQIRERIKELEK